MGVVSVTVQLDLPSKECSTNTKCHWAIKAAGVKGYRTSCGYKYLQAISLFRAAGMLPAASVVTMDTVWYLARNKKLWDGYYFPKDDGNAKDSLKPAIDALQDVGILKSDHHTRFKVGTAKLHTKAKDHKGRTELWAIFTMETPDGD